MSESRSAHRYAAAIIGVAIELKQLDVVSSDFNLMKNVIQSSKEFSLFLKSPIIDKEKKKKVLEDVFKGKMTDVTMKFIILITQKGRETILPEIIRQFDILRDKQLGIISVTLRSVTKINPDQRTKLIDSIQSVTKKTVRLNEVIDAQLIGGFSVQYEDTVWDGSVRRQLETLRGRLIGGVA
ncbi:MAG: ATP synthase F1 subunit delta [Bacteroidota bacterium]